MAIDTAPTKRSLPRRELPQNGLGAAQPGGGKVSLIEDPGFRKKFLELIREGHYLVVIARSLGIHPSSINNWKRRAIAGDEPYAAFMTEVAQAQAGAIVHRLKQVLSAADEGVWQASAWYLERKFPELFGRSRLDVSFKGRLDVNYSAVIRQVLESRENVEIANRLLAAITSRPFGTGGASVGRELRALGDGESSPVAELLRDGDGGEENYEIAGRGSTEAREE